MLNQLSALVCFCVLVNVFTALLIKRNFFIADQWFIAHLFYYTI